MAKQHTPGFLRIATEAKSRVKQTTVADLKRRMDAGDEFTLIDVREDNEWANGHLPGAIHLGKGIIERDIEKASPDPDAELVLYCGGGFRSALAADSLQRMGYRNILSMDGGYTAWKEAGHPTADGGALPGGDSLKKQGDQLAT